MYYISGTKLRREQIPPTLMVKRKKKVFLFGKMSPILLWKN